MESVTPSPLRSHAQEVGPPVLVSLKETANRALRDAMYTARYAEPGKAKLMQQPTAEAASLAGATK